MKPMKQSALTGLKQFSITTSADDPRYLYIQVGPGTIQIKLDEEGVVVDIFDGEDDVLATCYAEYTDILGE